MPTSFHFFFTLSIYLSLFGFINSAAYAIPCTPSDPNGENPGNLCLPNIYSHYQSGINSSSFQPGYASNGFTGTTIGPTSPGSPIIFGHKPGTPIDKHGTTNGYWNSIKSTDNGTTIKTNTGREWKIQPIRFP